jgi:hypothetical protein
VRLETLKIVASSSAEMSDTELAAELAEIVSMDDRDFIAGAPDCFDRQLSLVGHA